MTKDLSLRAKILLGYMAVIIVLIGLASWSIYNFVSLNESIHDIMVENYRSVIASEEMMEALERQDSAELIFIFGQQDKALNIFQENQMQFMKYLSRAEDNITIPEEKKIIKSLNQDYQEYLGKFMRLRKMAGQKSFSQVQKYYLQQIMPHFEKVKKHSRDLLMVNQEHMKQAQQRANDNATQAIYSTVIFSIVALILALSFGIYISNLIIKPIKELTAKIKEIAGGNLDQVIEIDTKDEIGQLAGEFNRMTYRLKEYETMNVSKLVEEKNKSEAIVKSISNPLLVTDQENKILLMNPRAEKLFDLTEHKILGTHFLESIKEDKIFDSITETLKSGEVKFGNDNQVIKFMAEDDKELYFRITTTPVKDKDNTTTLVVTLLEDITHLKEVDKMKSEFVSMVSHEFRTPLTSMNMGINMLLEENIGEVNDQQEELLEVAKEDCEHLNNLVDDLLDLSKIESGRIDLDFGTIQVTKIFETSIQPFVEQAKNQGIKLITEEVDNLAVYADLNKVTWVVTNLIGNALRYTEVDDEIRLSAQRKGHKVHISVADTGSGIPKEYQHKIFDKFVRAGADKDKGTGTGLGLAISKEIIEAHGGRIWVESEEGVGSTFTFTLKLPK
ncbi:hypothetical protein JCM16358_11770 [Halanaerocella petrolearia]